MTGPSVLRRVGLTILYVILGCLFFYLTLVVMSLYSKGITLDPLPYNAWARMASRATGAATVPTFVLSLLVSPASGWSLFFETWTCCSFAVHMMILATDTRVFEDPSFIAALKEQGNHPVLQMLPRRVLLVAGFLGYVAAVVSGLERTYGPNLGNRVPRFPMFSQLAHAYIWSVFITFFSDRLVSAIVHRKEMEELLYPLAFIALLVLGGGIAVVRHATPYVDTDADKANSKKND